MLLVGILSLLNMITLGLVLELHIESLQFWNTPCIYFCLEVLLILLCKKCIVLWRKLSILLVASLEITSLWLSQEISQIKNFSSIHNPCSNTYFIWIRLVWNQHLWLTEADDSAIPGPEQRANADAPAAQAVAERRGHGTVTGRPAELWRAVPDCPGSEDQGLKLAPSSSIFFLDRIDNFDATIPPIIASSWQRMRVVYWGVNRRIV